MKPPSAGVVLGTIALVVALGGTATAALPGNNQVFSADIRNGQVKTQDIRNGHVRAQDIRNGQITAAHVRDGAVQHEEIIAGAVRSVELRNGGVQAPDMGEIAERTNSVSIPAGGTDSVEAECNVGEIAISGGGVWLGPAVSGLELSSSYRRSATSWEVIGHNSTGIARTIEAQVYCLEA